ncbi:MAG TPA: DEAD/DEAH box helicase, partial [Thermodesulfobacteriota bacterium]
MELRHALHQAPDAGQGDRLARAQTGLAALLSGAGTSRFRVLGLKGSAIAFVAALLARRHAGRPLLLVTPSQKEAARLAEDLSFFLGEPAGPAEAPDRTRVRVFPSWDVLPFATLSPPSEIVHDRVEALARLWAFGRGGRRGPAPVVVVPVKALLERTLPAPVLAARVRTLQVGDEVDREELSALLAQAGYAPAPIVEDVGDFSIRGGIIDLFPPGYRWPLRLELEGDTIETIRTFDPQSQRSRGHLRAVDLVPVRELVADDARRREARRRLRERADELGFGRAGWGDVADAIASGFHMPGLETYLPDFHPDASTLLDYVPDDAILIRVDPIEIDKERDDYWAEIRQGHEQARREGRPVPDAAALYVEPAVLDRALEARGGITVERVEMLEPASADGGRPHAEVVRLDTETNEGLRAALAGSPGEAGLLAPLAERVRARRLEGDQVLLVCHTRVQATRLAELLEPYGLRAQVEEGPLDLGEITDGFRPAPGGLRIVVGGLVTGFRFPALGLTAIAEEEIFGERRRRRPGAAQAEQRAAAFLSSLADLRTGDIVVHVDHGVGIYRGLVNLELQGLRTDFLHLEYQGGDKLYVPVDRINLVQKYVGEQDDEAPPRVDRLGGTAWERVKSRVKASIREMTKELLALYAKRQVVEAYAFPPPDQTYREFEAAFEYEETPDQQAAIDEVLADLQKPRPMDRLVCGDVGYGKTEVAIRAAFLVVMAGKQVAILVPTTVLAQQHLATFTARFRRYPIRVESLSRFRSPKEQKRILEELAAGKIDVIIGTHRLLSKDVRFKDLGLVVVDEEQRFGVVHKEKLKQLRTQVHCLTMTATPIPRTLHMSLTGVRDLSVINTPPADRLAIRTYVTRFSDETIREAIMRELKRGG